MNDGRRRSPELTSSPADLESAVTARPGGAALAVRVIPRAGSSRIAGTRNGAILVRVAAAPVEGAANAALVSLISAALGVAPRNISITRGHHSRNKQVTITGADASTLRQILRPLVSTP
jgi:uncharacterized protein YggU (UPF0235/DUF167 family)